MYVQSIFLIIKRKFISSLGSSYDSISFTSSQGTISPQWEININIKRKKHTTKFEFFFVFISKNKRKEKIIKSNKIFHAFYYHDSSSRRSKSIIEQTLMIITKEELVKHDS